MTTQSKAKPSDNKQKSADTTLRPPRAGTKQAKLVGLLSRKSGVTLDKASQFLGWQPHTTSATMTGLRKRGYAIVREARKGKPGIYRIDIGACLPLTSKADGANAKQVAE